MDNPTLERRLKAKDKRVAELLEALKQIADMDHPHLPNQYVVSNSIHIAKEAIAKGE